MKTLYGIPPPFFFKVLLKEVEEFVGSKIKKFKEELVLNKKTGEYEKKWFLMKKLIGNT